MPFQMGWHKENQIVKVLVDGDVTLSEARNLDRALNEYLNAAEQPIHLLFDATQVNTFPMTTLQMRQTLSFLNHPQLGWIAFIDDGMPSNPLLHILSNLLGDKYRVFGSVKMGLDFIKSQDASIGGWSRRMPSLNVGSLTRGF
ncbi:MAG: hypothetical protein U0694_28800 [Anaerolineae bacterium]